MKKYLIILFVLGVIYRFWIANLVAQPFAFDQTEYHNFALQILDKGLVAWQARLYGYPLFLAVIYKIFGAGNFFAVSVVQSIVDSLTGVLIYLIGIKIFQSKKIAWVCYLLYLLNPFTSVYVVLTLSEVWGVFWVVLLTYLLVEFAASSGINFSTPPNRSRNSLFCPYIPSRSGSGVVCKIYSFLAIINSRLPHLLGVISLLLGFLPQVRPAFLFYGIVVLAWLVIGVIREMREMKILRGMMMVILFTLPFTYNIIGNWIYFKQFSLTTVDNLLVREFYISLYVPGRSPFHAKTPDVFPPEVQKIYSEYTPLPQNANERKAMADKYLNLGLQKVSENPLEFIITRLRKFWYVWEKHFLYYYTQPENKIVDFLTYWGNNLLILLGLAGFVSWYRKNKKSHLVWFGWFVIFTIAYISLVHSFSLAEERYSLPGYPFIFLFAGYGVWILLKRVLKIFPHQ